MANQTHIAVIQQGTIVLQQWSRSNPSVALDLDGADLRGADLRGANGGTLEMSDWHHCATTHCRAGWAIHLAGQAGYALEAAGGPATAAALIYAVSRPEAPIPDFYASNEVAWQDLLAHAGRSEGE